MRSSPASVRYVNQTRVAWDLFLEEDFRFRLDGIEDWAGDGIIADFDDPEVCKALSTMKLPIVAVGGSYEDQTRYPKDVAYVATDNRRLVELAFEHLVESGLTRFACYSLPESPLNRWAQEREGAFLRLMHGLHLPGQVHRGLATSAPTWNSAAHKLMAWLEALPKPIGIIAVTDARARQVMQACIMADISVPEEVAIVGIDNDTLGQHLTRIPLTSVSQGTHEMGRVAAHLDAPDAGRRAGAGRARRRAPRQVFNGASRAVAKSPTGHVSCVRCSSSGNTPAKASRPNRWPPTCACRARRSKPAFARNSAARCTTRSWPTSCCARRRCSRTPSSPRRKWRGKPVSGLIST